MQKVNKKICFLNFSWWPFISLLFYVLVPIPTMISKQQSFDSNSRGLEAAIFITVGLIFSSFALAIVLSIAGDSSLKLNFFFVILLIIKLLLQYHFRNNSNWRLYSYNFRKHCRLLNTFWILPW
jgi:hypothetical protein